MKFNKEFSLLAASASHLLGEFSVKELYLSAVESRVGAAVRVIQDQPLQKLMATALNMDQSRPKPTPHPNPNPTTPNSFANRPQNPDRIKCTKCDRWHHKDAPCRQSGSAARGGFGGRGRGPRVMEVHEAYHTHGDEEPDMPAVAEAHVEGEASDNEQADF